MPAGDPGSRLKVNDCGPESGSVAELVTARRLPSAIVRLSSGTSDGALFTSLTVMVMPCVALRLGAPLSVTRMVTGKMPGPCASTGVQVNKPFVALMASPAGAPGSRAKARVCAGRLVSVATALKLRRLPSSICLSPIAANTGGVFGVKRKFAERGVGLVIE